MGRRSRARAAGPAKRSPAPAARGGRRARAADHLSPVRRTLVRYLVAATLVAVVTVVGISSLGGSLGPFVVVAYTLLAAGLTFRWAQGALAGEALDDEDRLLQTAAAGMLLISAVLALVSAVLVSVL